MDIVIDTETTGLDPKKDEVLELAIVTIDGEVLFHHLIRPQRRKRWPDAQAINGIAPADVKNEKTLLDYGVELSEIFNSAERLIGYNVDFDLSMLRASGAVIRDIDTRDVMKLYAMVHGTFNEFRGRNDYVKLEECAEHYGYDYDAHSAEADAKATAFCWKAMQADEDYISCMNQIRAAEAERAAKDEAARKSSSLRVISCLIITIVAFISAFVIGLSNLFLAFILFVIGIIGCFATAISYGVWKAINKL